MQAKTAPNNRRCARSCLAGNQSIDPDDALTFALGHLASDKNHALFPFNYAQLHRSCLPQWEQRAYVKDLLSGLQASGKWKGASLKWILDRLHESR